MRHGLWRAASAWCALSGLTACSARIHQLKVDACPIVTTRAADAVEVQYLGVGGLLISRGDDVVMTAPLYSNPSLLEFAFDHDIRSDPFLIDQVLPERARKASAILVGHSHYDHLLDVPYVALHHAKDASIYGSVTTRNLLAPILTALQAGGRDVIPLDDKALDPWKQQPGEWVKVGKAVRVMAIRSEHSDQFELSLLGIRLPFHVFRGVVQHDALRELPHRGSEWAEGTVFAYLIDFLDEKDQPIFRVYYQDSGANQDIGLPTSAQLEAWGRRTVDLAVICVGGEWKRLRAHPESLIRALRPRFALLAHWEDFFVTQRAACVDKEFRSPPAAPRLLGFLHRTDVDRFRGRVKKAVKEEGLATRTWLPCPTASSFRLPVGSDDIVEAKTQYDCSPFYRYPLAP